MIRAVLILTLGVYSSLLYAQIQVSDPKFDHMLGELLDHSVPEVVPDDVQSTDTILFLDAREKKEYEVSHLPEALWVGYDTFRKKSVSDSLKNKPIIVYCTVGYRSEKIAEKLIKRGFTNVKNLYGGIFEWVHTGKEVVNENGPTQDVHTFDTEWAQWLRKGNKIHN